MSRLAVVMVALFGLGCTTAAKPAEEPAPVVIPPLAAPRASASAELALETQTPPPTPPLPRHPAGEEDPVAPPPTTTIGAACTEPRDCGKSGKVAVVHSNRQAFRVSGDRAPCKVVGTTKMHTMMAASACVDGDRVFVSSTCIMCRMPSGENLLGLVSDMTPAQLVRAQKLAALPETPLLTTTAAWSSAIAAAAKAAGSGG